MTTHPSKPARRGRAYRRTQTPKPLLMKQCATKFCELLERMDSRMLAVDGAVPQVTALRYATLAEERMLYRLADTFRRAAQQRDGRRGK